MNNTLPAIESQRNYYAPGLRKELKILFYREKVRISEQI